MNSTKSEAQYTQEGQAMAYNNLTCAQLRELFAPCLGPNGTYKALVSGGNKLSLTKDGIALCREIKYSHPTSIVITRSANSIHQRVGDGIVTYILSICEIFTGAFSYYSDGSKVAQIANSLQLAADDVSQHLKNSLLPLDDSNLRALVRATLSTKSRNSGCLTEIVLEALKHTADVKLIETLKMEGGDVRDSRFVAGLVLDHGPRHQDMPDELNDVCILVTNMSMEYEKPETETEFVYSTIGEREEFARRENDFILNKVNKIVELAKECRKKGNELLVVNEKGIDLTSLGLLGSNGITAVRRAKRKNLERLVGMCGGRIVTDENKLSLDSLGYAKTMRVERVGEEVYTFIEGVPMKGACTILIRGNVDYGRIRQSIKGTLVAVMLAVRDKCCIRGGRHLYVSLIKMLRNRNVNPADSVGYEILIRTYEALCKTLIKNSGGNPQEEYAKLLAVGDEEEVIENATVLGNVFTNAVYTAINLLMCDEMILAGKPIKE